MARVGPQRRGGGNFKGTGWDIVGWIHMAQARYPLRFLVNAAVNFRVPYNMENFLNGC